MKSINISLFLADESDIGINLSNISLAALDSIENLSGLDVVVAKVSSVNSPSEEDTQLVYGLSKQDQPDLALLLVDSSGKTLGLILPDELEALKVECEAPPKNAKDLGSASSSSWASYTRPVIYRCVGNAQHPRFACIQKGAEIPDKCPICKSGMKEIKQ